MENNLNLLSIGDASLDVFITPTETETYCKIDDKECFICFSYGDKIPAKDLEFSIGGNAANNAVGARRLGINSSAVITLGSDNIGNQIIEKLKKENVDTRFVFQKEGIQSNYSTIINYLGERTIFTFKDDFDYSLPELPHVPWVYLTSMGDSFRPAYAQIASFIRENPDIKLAFNPGSRQLRAVKDLDEILSLSHIIYINRKEAEIITNFEDSHGREKDLLKSVVEKGPKTAIITDGGNGSFAFDGSTFFRAQAMPIDAYERTGAGDSFGAGCLAALIKGKPLSDALLWGTLNSASVIGFVGSQKGLLRENEMPKWIERAKSCNLKVEQF